MKKGNSNGGAKPKKSPKKPEMAFTWTDTSIEACMQGEGDAARHLAKYAGSTEQITADGSAPAPKRWVAPAIAMSRHSRALPVEEKVVVRSPLVVKREHDLRTKPAKWVLRELMRDWTSSNESKRLTAAAYLPVKCFDSTDFLTGESTATYCCLLRSVDAGGAPDGEWVDCQLSQAYEPNRASYTVTLNNNTEEETRAACEVHFGAACASTARRLQAALVRRRECEALLRFHHYVGAMPSDPRVVKSADFEQWSRILSVALSTPELQPLSLAREDILAALQDELGGSKSPKSPKSPKQLTFENDSDASERAATVAREAMGECVKVMNLLVMRSDVLNASNFNAYLSLGLPQPTPEKSVPAFGVLQNPAGFDFAACAVEFSGKTFLGTPEVVEALVAVQVHALAMRKVKILDTTGGAPQTPEAFAALQDQSISGALRQLKESWLQKTASSIRQALATADNAVYNCDEGTMAHYAHRTNKLFMLLKRVNFTMTQDLFKVTSKSLRDFADFIISASKADVIVESPSHVRMIVNSQEKTQPLFLMTVVITAEKRVLNKRAVAKQQGLIEAWGRANNVGDDDACPLEPIQPVQGVTFDYETPLEDVEHCVIQAFRSAIRETRTIPHVQRYIMERLFWPRPEMIPAITGERVIDEFTGRTAMRKKSEMWVGELEDSIRAAVLRAIKPAQTYLECFTRWEEFLNVDVDAYVNSCTHVQVNDEAVEEGEEAEGPPVRVDLKNLTNILLKHTREQELIGTLIPAAPLEAGLCLLNASDLRAVLTLKHAEILRMLLVRHSENVLSVADFVEHRFAAVESHLKKKPRDIEETTDLEEYLSNVNAKMAPLQEFIDEMRRYTEVLDQFGHRIDFENFEKIGRAAYWPCKIANQCEETARIIANCRDRFLEDMMSEQDRFGKSLLALDAFANSFVQYEELGSVHEAAARAAECYQKITAAEEKSRLYNSREQLFERESTDYDQLAETKKAFEPYYQLWSSAAKWIDSSQRWNEDEFISLDAEAMETEVAELSNSITKASKFFERTGMAPQASVAKEMKEQINAFKPNVPVVVALRNKGMRDRHWEEVGGALGIANFALDEQFTLAALLELKPLTQSALITKVSEAAAKEYNIELQLDRMLEDWTPMELTIANYRDTGTGVIKGVDEITAILDEHITATQAMQFSAFKGPFEERIEAWNRKLYTISEVLEAWLSVQRNWMYLQPIFESPDINKQLPAEGRKFATVDKNWKQTISSAKSNPIVMDFCDSEKLFERLRDSDTLLDQVQKGLNDYLETKRGVFSRFYFLSNDDLLSILSESKDVTRVQPHFKKCFEAIDAVEFGPFPTENCILKMISPEKETVPMLLAVEPVGKNVEDWMTEVEDMMRLSVRSVMRQSILDYPKRERTEWMQVWPSMCVLNSSQMHWTMETEQHFEQHGIEGPKKMLERQLAQLTAMVVLVRGDLPNAARAQVGALAVIDVHARDVQIKMAKNGVCEKSDFGWQSQLRYYWIPDAEEAPSKRKSTQDDSDDGGDLWAEMVAAKRKYGYEYLGNSFRLVITPLTDKCYLTLMGALQMVLGGAPAGPAGTGKTETTKDLAKAVAMQCVVFNCSDGLDFQAMGKFFKGLASCGAWACFDEFNRINIEVLSVIGQQIMSIQLAIKAGTERIDFEGSNIKVKSGFGVFITMNPGYAGRSALPDSLSALFRPVAMMVPDYALIGEIMFFAYGFASAKELGRKMVTTFKLCSEQCSNQPHYDYGMRAVKTVITAAGNLKRAEPDADEMILLLRALQDVNVPKFLANDLPLFQGIISDLFPGKQRPVLDYGDLFSVMKLEISKLGLQPHGWFISKVIQLYEMIVVRHGLMLVGPTGGGKSANLHVLEGTLGALKERGVEGFAYDKVLISQLNPKSITMGQMYGQFDDNTREWQDGIMSTMYRRAAASTTEERKWIMFDGPVDAIWIENMNTVLDDNKKLCLVSGESIKMSNEMTMMFEVEDLLVASPATVSRVGIIYMEPKALGLDALVQSWLARTFESSSLLRGGYPAFRGNLLRLFDQYLYAAVAFVRLYADELVTSMDNNLVQSLTRLLDCYLEPFYDKEGREPCEEKVVADAVSTFEARFIFALIWSVGCTAREKGRARFDGWLRALLRTNAAAHAFPEAGTVYDYVFDVEKNIWLKWMETVQPYVIDSKLSFSELIVPTPDSVRSTYLLAKLLEQRCHVLFVGETGTGKTVNVQQYLQGATQVEAKPISDAFIPMSMTFSAQTSANMTQDTLDGKFEKRRRGVFGPPAGKTCAVHVDDLNMPKRETYGAQPPIEILRQWFDQGGWYDRSGDLAFRKIADIVFVASMGPPGGGKQDVTSRFIRHFNICGLAELSDASKSGIFTTILQNFLNSPGFDASVSKCAPAMVASTIDFFNVIVATLLPTPSKSHYTFNLRDLAKVFQGVLMGSAKFIQEPKQIVRLWVHELSRVFEDRLTTPEDHGWFRSATKNQVAKHFGIDWAEIQPKNGRILYCDFQSEADPRPYVEVEDLEQLKTTVNGLLADHNNESKSPMPLVMFLDAIEHVLRIARILRQPQGNALLLGVGGSGRQSMSKLATYVSGYELFQVEISKGYGLPEWREDLRKCLLSAGVKDRPTTFIFSDVQVVSESFLEDINNILNAGDVPNLYGPEEMEQIVTACRSDCQKKGLPPTKINIFAQYIVRVRRNLHICLCMSPLGETFRERLRQFPSLVNCCTIDWFTEWPAEALESVARSALTEQQSVPEEDREAVVKVFKAVHQSVEVTSVEFWDCLRRHNYVTPTSYLELLSSFATLLGYKRDEVATKKDRLQIGLDKLTSTKALVSGMQEELVQLQPLLVTKGKEVDDMMVRIDVDKKAAAEDKAKVQVVEEQANTIAKKAKSIADDAQRDLDEALPALEAAVQCLKELKKSHIDEVKALRNPPSGVRLTMEVACIYFEVPPVKVADPNNPVGKKVDDYFGPAGKVLLADAAKFLKMLQDFDKDNIPDKVIKKVGPYMALEEFTPERIKAASVACTAVCMWAHAMHKYHFVALGVAPKKAKHAEATAELDAANTMLHDAQGRLAKVVEKLAGLEKALGEAIAEKKTLADKEVECKTRLANADKLVGGLGGEQVRWTKTVDELSVSLKNVVGDVCVSAATVSYLGPFTSEFRQSVVQGWHETLRALNLSHTTKCDLEQTLAEPVKIRMWQLAGLPTDSLSTQNGIMLDRARRWALFIDPQGQANRFIRNRGRDKEVCPNGFDVTKLSDKNMLRTLENGVRFGKWVLIENIGETLDAALEPILLQSKFKSGGQDMIKLGESTIPYNEDFKLILTTKLPNPHYAPEVQVKVSLINFTVTQSGLEEQLLGDAVELEMPDLALKKSELVVQQAVMNKELFDIESEILVLLSNSTGNILDDTNLIETLAQAKMTADEVNSKMRDAEATAFEVQESSEEYRPVAKRASLLYFCLADLADVDPMYQYALPWFKKLFAAGVRQTPLCQKTDERVEKLNDVFSYYVYTNVCRSLFEKHKLLFSFLLTIKIMDDVDQPAWRFCISGQSASPAVTGDNPDPEWIGPNVWDGVLTLSGLDCFADLAMHFREHLTKWKHVYDSVEPHLAKLPAPYQNLSGLQHLCIIRTLRRDKLTDAISLFVSNQEGQRYVEPPSFDLGACFEDSSKMNPLVFVLSTGSDPNKNIVELADKLQMLDKFASIALGQGQGEIAARLIEKSTAEGSWVLLQNCHLCISWLPALERIVESFEPEKIGDDFRLWLTSMPSPHFPVAILQLAVKMTKEPPRGLKANLKTTFLKMNDERLSRTNKPDSFRKLLFGLCFFHALIIERKKFGPLGWNVPYEFNETDLDICIAQLELYVDQYAEIPYAVLSQLTSVVNYGGRITDDKDMRTADIVVGDFMSPKILESSYKFSASGTYYSLEASSDRPLKSYLDYIDSLPQMPDPEVFGMHDNASITCALTEADELCNIVVSLQPRSGGGGGGLTREDVMAAAAAEMEAALPAPWDVEAVYLRYPTAYTECLNTTIVQEAARFSALSQVMVSTLKTFQLALKGLVVLSSDLEAMGNAIYDAGVPALWASKSYPSLKPLPAWYADLLKRLDFLQKWIDHGTPDVLWISVFFFPQGFMTANLQNYARRTGVPVDTVEFGHVLMNESVEELLSKPTDGCYTNGLFLEGGRWDKRRRTLTDPRPKELFSPMPVIHLLPQVDRELPTHSLYRCPVYKILTRTGTLSTTGHSTNFVFWLEVPSKMPTIFRNSLVSETNAQIQLADQDTWIKAGAACFCALKY